MPEAAVLKIPPDFPLDKAALLGCGVITGVGAVVNAAKVKMGSSVPSFGCGGIGLNAVQGTHCWRSQDHCGGCRTTKARIRPADGCHAPCECCPSPVAAIKDLTGGRGVDYAFEAIGLTTTIEQAYALHVRWARA